MCFLFLVIQILPYFVKFFLRSFSLHFVRPSLSGFALRFYIVYPYLLRRVFYVLSFCSRCDYAIAESCYESSEWRVSFNASDATDRALYVWCSFFDLVFVGYIVLVFVYEVIDYRLPPDKSNHLDLLGYLESIEYDFRTTTGIETTTSTSQVHDLQYLRMDSSLYNVRYLMISTLNYNLLL